RVQAQEAHIALRAGRDHLHGSDRRVRRRRADLGHVRRLQLVEDAAERSGEVMSTGDRRSSGWNGPGFTLVEILIVIVILGIVTGIVAFAVGNMTTTAKSTGCAAEKTTLGTALEEYKAHTGSYPTTMTALTSGSGAFLKSTPVNYDIDTSGNIVA